MIYRIKPILPMPARIKKGVFQAADIWNAIPALTVFIQTDRKGPADCVVRWCPALHKFPPLILTGCAAAFEPAGVRIQENTVWLNGLDFKWPVNLNVAYWRSQIGKRVLQYVDPGSTLAHELGHAMFRLPDYQAPARNIMATNELRSFRALGPWDIDQATKAMQV